MRVLTFDIVHAVVVADLADAAPAAAVGINIAGPAIGEGEAADRNYYFDEALPAEKQPHDLEDDYGTVESLVVDWNNNYHFH